jgi:hypothetical protein
MPYQYLAGVSGTTSESVTLSNLITVPKLVVKVLNLVPHKGHWVRAGYIEAVNFTGIGEVRSKAQWLKFGQTEIEFEPPGYPYNVRFIPRDYVTRWELEIFTKDRSGSDGSPSVPLSQAESTSTGWVIW